MRHFGYQDWLETVSHDRQIGINDLTLKFVDPIAAIMALRSAGGPPTSDDELTDVANGLGELLIWLTRLRPFRNNFHDRATLAAGRKYAQNRGYELNLRGNGLDLIEQIDVCGLDRCDIRRSLVGALRRFGPTARRSGQQQELHAAKASIARAISDPTPELIQVTHYIDKRIEELLIGRGVQVLTPSPKNRIANDGSRWHAGTAAESSEEATTEDLFVGSMKRVSSADVLVIIADPKSAGVHVEREWALRLGIPIVELRLSRTPHPHQDGPARVVTIDVDKKRPHLAVRAFEQALDDHIWAVLDQKADAAAHEIKNADAIAQLRTSWSSLMTADQRCVAKILQMSRGYISGLLHNGLSLELASDRQRRGLEVALQVGNTRGSACDRRMSDLEIELLSMAGDDLGLSGVRLVRAVVLAHEGLVKPRLKTGLRGPEDARRCMIEATKRLDALTDE
jgi:hypothetical protein